MINRPLIQKCLCATDKQYPNARFIIAITGKAILKYVY